MIVGEGNVRGRVLVQGEDDAVACWPFICRTLTDIVTKECKDNTES